MDNKTNKIMIIGFSLNQQYDSKNYDKLLKKYNEIYYTETYKYFWKRNFFILLKELYENIRRYKFRMDTKFFWVSFKYLKKKPFFSKAILINPKTKHKIENIKKAFNCTNDIASLMSKDSFSYKINDVECSAYLLDSLQRFVPLFKIYNFKSPINFISTWIYIYNVITYLEWLDKFVKKNKIDAVLVNHEVYMESGFVSCYLKEKFNLDIIHLSARSIDPFIVKPRKKWFKETLEKKLSQSLLSKKIIEHKKNTWRTENALYDIEDCSEKTFDKNFVAIIMHCFGDANNMHFENGVIFSSYFQWIRSTIEIAKSQKNINYIFRAHPDSFHKYAQDIRVFDYFFKNLNEKNISFQKPGSYTQLISQKKMPLFVTAKGNFSQELAVAGIKSITIDDTSAPNDCCKKMKSKKEYINWLTGQENLDDLRLSEKLKFKAKLNKKIYFELNN